MKYFTETNEVRHSEKSSFFLKQIRFFTDTNQLDQVYFEIVKNKLAKTLYYWYWFKKANSDIWDKDGVSHTAAPPSLSLLAGALLYLLLYRARPLLSLEHWRECDLTLLSLLAWLVARQHLLVWHVARQPLLSEHVAVYKFAWEEDPLWAGMKDLATDAVILVASPPDPDWWWCSGDVQCWSAMLRCCVDPLHSVTSLLWFVSVSGAAST